MVRLVPEACERLVQVGFVFGRRLHGRHEGWDEVVTPFEHDVDVAGGLFDAATKCCDAVESGDAPCRQSEDAEGSGTDAVNEPFAGIGRAGEEALGRVGEEETSKEPTARRPTE